jgi:flagellar secretion chaperone FliS
MSYHNAAVAYRDQEVQTATPGRLIVLVFDHVLTNLARASVANKNNMIEHRIEAVAKARDGVAELLGSLDMEEGGSIAEQLRSLYAFVLAQLADAGMRFDETQVARLAGIMRELREAFAAITSGPAKVSV